MRDATKIDEYFTGEKTLFLIPLYQRKYAWQRKHCERLFADLIKVSKENRRSHFFGSIVSIKANEVDDDLLIIDGQQRITTISLLILAAIQAYKDGHITCDGGEEYVKDMTNKYLMAKYKKGDRKIKLRPIESDRIAYDALMNGDSENIIPADKSGITLNYQIFYELLKLQELSFDELIEAIEKLIIIDIRLDSGDNPQLIFESLNSCGKDLEEADKVRNYLLMSLSSAQQEEYYNKYWSKIEACTDDEPTMFIRDYLTIKTKLISKITDLYFDFKSFDERYGVPREELLAEMLKYAKYYKQATKGETGNSKVDKKFHQLSNIGSSVCMPFYMQFLDYAACNGISSDEIYKVLDVVENYWARRIICSYPANVMSKTFAILHSDVLRIINDHIKRNEPLEVTYSELVKHILLKKQGTAIFPKDSEVKTAFPSRQIYKIPIDYRYFLFERMENENSKEGDDTIVPRMKNNEVTIEHIMPQTLNQKWKDDLGEKWQTIYDTYLHTFANLTLTGYNSSYGNHSFEEKKQGYSIMKDGESIQIYGFQDSAFRLSNYLKSCDKWTEDEMKARGELLLNKFLALWPMINSTYVPLEKETDNVSFNDDELELTGRKIASFTYKGINYKVTSWKEMLVLVSKFIYADEPVQMNSLAAKDMWYHRENAEGRTQIADNCFVFSSCSTKTKCTILTYAFEQLGLNFADLEFELIPLSDKETISNEE